MSDFPASDTIPLPRLRTILVAGVMTAVAWSVWQEHQQALVRGALWDTAAAPIQRVQAAESFAKMGASAVPELVSVLERGDAQARELAVIALGQIGPAASSAGPKLVELLDDPEENVRLVALRVLQRLNHSLDGQIPRIAALLAANDGDLREQAVLALIGLGPSVIPSACRGLEGPSPDGRRSSAMVLGGVGEGDPAAVGALRAALSDADRAVRGTSFRILARWDVLTLEETVTGLQSADTSTAAVAARYAARFTDECQHVVPALTHLLGHDRAEARSAALESLASFGPQARSTIPEVLSFLQRATRREEPLALRTLGRIAAGESHLVPIVERYLFDASVTAAAAGDALSRLSPEHARVMARAMALRLEDPDCETRLRAAAALDGLGKEASETVPALIAALSDGSDRVRFHASGALQQIGTAAEVAVPELATLAGADPTSRRRSPYHTGTTLPTRVRAIAALGSAGRDNGFAIRSLFAAARSSESAVRRAAVAALVQTTCDKQVLVDFLAEALSDPSGAVRAQAALSLPEIQLAPKAVVPLLEGALSDEEILVRKAAAAALGEYGGDAASYRDLLEDFVSQPDEPFDEEFDEEEDGHGDGSEDFAGMRRAEPAEPLLLLARRSMRSIALEALKKVDGSRRA